jgi:hypothetical protein
MNASTVLQNVLDRLPTTGTPRDNRTRAALRTALDVLNRHGTEQEAISAAAQVHFLRDTPSTPAAPSLYPPEIGQGGARKGL